MFWPEAKFDISTALLLVRYLVISEMFGSDYVKVGIPEKSTLWYLGIVWSPAPDKEVGTEQIFFFNKMTVVLKNNFPGTLMFTKEASENTHACPKVLLLMAEVKPRFDTAIAWPAESW